MSAPAELAALREREAEIVDLYGALVILSWDQGTYMPPGGAGARGDALATVEKLAHERMVDPALGALLDRLEPWADSLDPDSDEARLIRWTRRDHEKAVRVPTQLAADMAREAGLGQSAWLKARDADDFSLFRDALARQIDLRHRYAACFPEAAHPYDVLLDDYEPDLTAAELRPLFVELIDALAPLVQAAGVRDQPRNGGVFDGPYGVDAQRSAIVEILVAMGFDPQTWRLDVAAHPFARSPGPGDYRITTRYREDDFASGFFSALHEFGHGLYDAGLSPSLSGTLLHSGVSLGVHESQSRLWENVVGRGRPYCAWVLPRLQQSLPGGLGDIDAADLYRAVNTVQPSLIRTESDETTYNLHIALRFDLELRLIDGELGVDDVPAEWNEAMERLFGVAVRTDCEGILQDIHWAEGFFGYFPTYTLGNLMAAQLWARARADIDDLDATIERGDFAVLRDWLRENIHQHGRKFAPRELLRRVTGEDLSTEPFLAYLRGKLEDSGVLATRA